MRLNKVIALGVVTTFLVGAGASFFITSTTEAKPFNNNQKKESIIKKNYNLTQKERVEVSYFKKRTTFSEEDIAKLLKKGFNRENIKEVYVLSQISTDKFDDILSVYQDEDRDIDMTLKDLKLDTDKYQEQFKKVFPDGDDTDFDRVVRSKPVWTLSPPK